MLEITEDEIWNYMMCPAFFEMTRRKVVSDTSQAFRGHVNTVIKRFCTNLMNGTVLPVNKLKKLWDTICLNNPDIITQQKCVEGYAAINKMYKWASDIRLRILDVAVPYSTLFTGRNGQRITVKGEIPVIAVNRKNMVEILIFDIGTKRTNQVRTDMNLKYTLHCQAYLKQTGYDIGIHVRNLKYDEDIFSYRNVADFNRLKRTVADIGFAIDNEIFYPREGLGCLACNVAGACRVWN